MYGVKIANGNVDFSENHHLQVKSKLNLQPCYLVADTVVCDWIENPSSSIFKRIKMYASPSREFRFFRAEFRLSVGSFPRGFFFSSGTVKNAWVRTNCNSVKFDFTREKYFSEEFRLFQ